MRRLHVCTVPAKRWAAALVRSWTRRMGAWRKETVQETWQHPLPSFTDFHQLMIKHVSYTSPMDSRTKMGPIGRQFSPPLRWKHVTSSRMISFPPTVEGVQMTSFGQTFSVAKAKESQRIHLTFDISYSDTYIRVDPYHILLRSRERRQCILGTIHLPFLMLFF